MKSPCGAAFLCALVLALLLVPAGACAAQQAGADKSLAEVQTRGPIHEAFAQPLDLGVQPDPVVPKQPPAPLPEQPPDIKPDGAGVDWVPGYWAWDAEVNEFLWIGGVYRNAPPGRVYVPGYWQQTADGWRWVHGFWAPADQPEMPYVPQPPASLEVGPSVPPPADDCTYVPGYWAYRDTRFGWRPGYYLQWQPGYVWIPPCYLWTPGGCLFVSGYWDYPLDRRGLLCAPVAFRGSPWLNPRWAWQPVYALSTGALLDSLFVDARFRHYRFGDYYSRSYLDRGIRPWHLAGSRYFDPLYAYYRVANRASAGWQTNLAALYNNRLIGNAVLPPRSLQQQATVVKQTGNANLRMVVPLSDANPKLARLSSPQVQQTTATAQRIRDAAQVRLKNESNLALQPSRSGTLNTAAARSLSAPTNLKAPASLSSPIPEAKAVKKDAGVPLATAKAIVHDPKLVSNVPKINQTAHSAPSVKTAPAKATMAATRVVHTPPRPQAHASRPKPPPAHHGVASAKKEKSK
jgi:hypothetical protein